MANVTKEARYILTDLENNNNKFWTIRLFDDSTCETQWGRVGENGQSKSFADQARRSSTASAAKKRARAISRPRRWATGSAASLWKTTNWPMSPKTRSPPTARKLWPSSRIWPARMSTASCRHDHAVRYQPRHVLHAAGHRHHDAIVDARALLTDIGAYVHAQDYGNKCLLHNLNDYLMLVPQNIGRGKPDPRILYPNLEAVQAQNNILDSLEASLQTILAAPKYPDEAVPPKMFEARLNLVNDGVEIDRIRGKYRATLQATHACAHLDVKRVFSIEIGAMRRAFEAEGRKIGGVQELWHGTKASNVLSILKSGFYIPPTNAPYVTGRLFGNGVYFANSSTKSLNYAYGYWDGKRDNNCFMFLCDVAMGSHYTPKYGEALPKPGFDSTWAKAGESGVQNDELIVYNTNQIEPRFLIEFSPAGK